MMLEMKESENFENLTDEVENYQVIHKSLSK
jgi:hypothetical protein